MLWYELLRSDDGFDGVRRIMYHNEVLYYNDHFMQSRYPLLGLVPCLLPAHCLQFAAERREESAEQKGK